MLKFDPHRSGGTEAGARLLPTDALSGLERYQLLTSLVVPRPIGWLSTRGANGVANLAPFSYFAALSATPLLVGVSVGSRGGVAKDSLRNIRESGAFCVNVVTEPQLQAMNRSSAEVPAEQSEFELAGLPVAEAEGVAAPYVASCPAVLQCRLFKEVALEGSANTLIIGEAVLVRLAEELAWEPGTRRVSPETLRPVGRLGGDRYMLAGAMPNVPRPG